MNKLLYLLFLSVFLLDFFHFNLGIVPRSATWIPEVLAMLTGLIVLLRLASTNKSAIHPKYIILIILYFIIIFIGIIFNSTPAASIIVGLRFYLKHLPFFLLPAVYDFSEEEFKKQLLFILLLLILQCPLTVYQRLYQYRGLLTGDVVTGTLEVSSALSVTMICSIAIIFALYVKKQIGLRFFFITVWCLFLPTTLNETKVTLFLLPVALALPAFFFREEGSSKIKKLLTMGAMGVLFILAFVPIYDHFMKPRTGYGILDFFQKENRLEKYMFREEWRQQGEPMGRGDVIAQSYKNLSKNPLVFAFGLGMGNLMGSYFESAAGKHADQLQYGGDTLAVTILFWELGLLGVAVYATFFVFVFSDALLLRKSGDIFGSFSLGWTAVVVIIGISLFYNNIFHFNVMNFIFWYFSGTVVAKTCRMRALL